MPEPLHPHPREQLFTQHIAHGHGHCRLAFVTVIGGGGLGYAVTDNLTLKGEAPLLYGLGPFEADGIRRGRLPLDRPPSGLIVETGVNVRY